jgi:myo-inositol-1(or 4)-monophosphatase
LVQILGKYSKFASAGEKAALRQSGIDADAQDQAKEPAPDAAPAIDAGEDAPL